MTSPGVYAVSENLDTSCEEFLMPAGRYRTSSLAGVSSHQKDCFLRDGRFATVASVKMNPSLSIEVPPHFRVTRIRHAVDGDFLGRIQDLTVLNALPV
jgi:hypothetical protein